MGQKKILGLKTFGPKKFWVQKILGQNKFCVWKIFEKICVWKKLKKKILGLEKNFGSKKKFWIWKQNLGSEKILSSK